MNCDQVQNHGFSISSNVALVAVQGFQLKKLITSLESCLFTEVLNSFFCPFNQLINFRFLPSYAKACVRLQSSIPC